jgi:uncharacterized membrane protein YhaH (DUF805 family)
VSFIQSVFCLKGFDDRGRFFATSLVSLFGFILCSAIFVDYLIINFLCLIMFTIVLICGTKRRLHDAKLNKNWQLVPGILLLLTGALILMIENSSSYYFLILPALSTSLLLTYPSKNKRTHYNYILGYYGPVDLTIYTQEATTTGTQNQRIEPTIMTNDINEQSYTSEAAFEQCTTNTNHQADTTQADIGELIRLKFINNRKLQLSVIISVALIFIAVLFNSLFSSLSQSYNATNDVSKEQNLENLIVLAARAQLLPMPDNFNLYLSSHQGIIIHWQADQVVNGELWSQLTAKGEKSCQSIKFNKGDPFRPLSVIVENGSEYFASFSPLDSAELAQALAFRSKFYLCGYSFSLTGSQAILGKNAHYAPFLDENVSG